MKPRSQPSSKTAFVRERPSRSEVQRLKYETRQKEFADKDLGPVARQFGIVQTRQKNLLPHTPVSLHRGTDMGKDGCRHIQLEEHGEPRDSSFNR